MNDRTILKEYIDSLNNADSFEKVYETCVWLCEQYGFDHFHYGAQIPTSLTKPSFIHISGYPLEWWNHYKDNNYIAYDPTITHCSQNILPYEWSRAQFDEPNTNIPNVMEDAKDFGLLNGLSIPLHDANGVFSMLSFSCSSPHTTNQDTFDHILPLAHYISSLTHEAVMRVAVKNNQPALANQSHLTKREKECLLWVAEGKTTWETSQILRISERTVVFHCQNASQKLNVNNRPQAIARAISLGIITPQFST